MTGRIFIGPDTWTGGDFDLLLELGPRDDQRLADALSAMWGHPSLTGCYLDNTKEPIEQRRLEPNSQPLESRLYGVAKTPSGHNVACYSIPIRYDDGLDCLYLMIPIGALGAAYPLGAYPFDDATSIDWVLPVSEWLRSVGEYVFESVAFGLGLIGWEADGDSATIEREGIPDERRLGYLWPTNNTLSWYPPNMMRAPLVLGKRINYKPWWKFW